MWFKGPNTLRNHWFCHIQGQILVNGESVLELDVEAKNGRLHSLEGLLIPPSIEPIIPHRCDIKETSIVKVSPVGHLHMCWPDVDASFCLQFIFVSNKPFKGWFAVKSVNTVTQPELCQRGAVLKKPIWKHPFHFQQVIVTKLTWGIFLCFCYRVHVLAVHLSPNLNVQLVNHW